MGILYNVDTLLINFYWVFFKKRQLSILLKYMLTNKLLYLLLTQRPLIYLDKTHYYIIQCSFYHQSGGHWKNEHIWRGIIKWNCFKFENRPFIYGLPLVRNSEHSLKHTEHMQYHKQQYSIFTPKVGFFT